mmetsp:Transcript_29574/g.62731  ORF Transcript_29574/g.62731 Transcript_29574/m.62731 type:complete len:184 (+) Transcript_29574:63-614(+)|eukprot:CAMPEP_0172319984 /NCGR_PEP_ID=MMETSP1058-20130122/39272_1 /TAXON_ID=83371 /ORGANISM="Detonula confervacea, Strain CCMP 353" /LENGTH=183 /DNA_ID=CAMNT_0013035151 /DNA_START=1 /DNA_END=552 /DNA_ORIENTATION=-
MGPSTLSSPSLKAAAAAATAVLVTSLLLHQRNAIKTYYRRHRGVDGFLRLLWVGDFLPPHLRQSMDELDQVEERMRNSEGQLEQIEISVERTRLESVDGSTSSADDIVDKDELKSQLFQQNPELRTKIGGFSSKLDAVAAKIDSIKSHSDQEVKQRKKQLSNRIVELMNELDRMVATLNLDVI